MRPAIPLALLVLALLAGCAQASHVSTIHIDYGGQLPSVDADVQVKVLSHPAAALRIVHAAPTPPVYTAMDQLKQWSSESKVPIGVSYSTSFGFFLTRINGLPASDNQAYWSLVVNGTTSPVGMEQVAVVPGSRITWTLTSLEPAPAQTTSPTSSSPVAPSHDGPSPSSSSSTTASTPTGLSLTAPARMETRTDRVTINGTTTPGAKLSVRHATGTMTLRADGSWTYTTKVPFGHSYVNVTADDGATTQQTSTLVVRLAHGTVQVHFNSYPGGPADHDDAVWFDLDGQVSAPMYEGKDLQHPAFANVHDLMVSWTNQTGTSVDYGYSNGLGFSVSKIAGIGSPLGGPTTSLYWCYDDNGASASAGITGQQLNPGDTVTWKLGCV